MVWAVTVVKEWKQFWIPSDTFHNKVVQICHNLGQIIKHFIKTCCSPSYFNELISALVLPSCCENTRKANFYELFVQWLASIFPEVIVCWKALAFEWFVALSRAQGVTNSMHLSGSDSLSSSLWSSLSSISRSLYSSKHTSWSKCSPKYFFLFYQCRLIAKVVVET